MDAYQAACTAINTMQDMSPNPRGEHSEMWAKAAYSARNAGQYEDAIRHAMRAAWYLGHEETMAHASDTHLSTTPATTGATTTKGA